VDPVLPGLTAGHVGLAASGDLAVARATIAAVDDPGLAATRRRMLALVDGRAGALHRTCEPGHLTGSALVVDAGAERVVVMLHRKLGRWLQPGGHADGDANLAAVALREATEETGITGLAVVPRPIDLDIHRVRPPGEPEHEHHDLRFLVLAPPGAEPVGNHESRAIRWARPDELPALGADPGLLRLAEVGLAEARRRRS
jgi:8-oxo-dGTP pyrophosphatase MutT (NUDIX family)